MRNYWASLAAQWLRIHLPMQVRALVREDRTCRGATKPVPQLLRLCSGAHMPQLLSLCATTTELAL